MAVFSLFRETDLSDDLLRKILYYLLYLIVVKFRLGLYFLIHVKIDIEVYLV